MTQKRLETSVEIRVRASIQSCFDLVTLPGTPAECFSGYGPIPGTRASFMEDGGPMRQGGIRVIESADGSVMRESILTNQSPTQHAYASMGPLAPPLGRMVSQVGGTWDLVEVPGATQIRWTFFFVPTTLWARLPVWVLLRVFMARAMARCLDQVRARIEKNEDGRGNR